ncbi:hypothetical protein D2E29_03560 [Mycobacteroides abscessus]|uniref:hypothetical protein n=1 Tax=Mycobacteroides abscessus TaxID=36809 RepID=UPI00092628EB|nr:hypothetical protein [Mycobacteroides abscessus]MDO3118321.1 hypothetical protein [Mycobacteroides abscessus subsp. abscessus]MDO3325163.1 hypothetical protein [Mycobacteroides abscessus subsp. abscessus]RIR13638.1 hypothetical protein D2E29_03560 [Mycobacteroides abscessus]SHT88670.1 Uncharacterised protein [Mycobacteroides abscessus subsp. abscessus]SHW38971.1 Uncharacterised protein [Mycobacteroides abscessus subsp. abscessus]
MLVTLASGVVIGAAAAPMTAVDPGVKLTYRVTLQDPGTNRQVTISYRTGKGEKAVKQTWLDPFVPWEHDVTMTTREAVVSLFSDPGGNYLGEILRDGNVIASNSVYLEPGWVAEQSAPYGTPTLLARADVP